MSDFQAAISDYRYLRERNYSARAALKLVGDRHALTAKERNLMFRGVSPAAEALGRLGRLVSAPQLAGQSLGIDWYNVLITVESYLKGSPVFIADDGVVRDAAAVHGSYRESKVTERAVSAIVAAVCAATPARAEVFVDAPVAFSGAMAATLRSRLLGRLELAVEVCSSPDHALKGYAGVVASSDSAIIDRAAAVFDLARFTLLSAFGFEPPELEALARPV